MIVAEARPCPAPSARGRDLKDEYIFLDRRGDRLHVLNSTARQILLRCDGRHTVAEIAAELAAEFDVPPDEARRDVCALLSSLCESGLIEFQ